MSYPPPFAEQPSWNADRVQSVLVSETRPSNNEILVYTSADRQLEYGPQTQTYEPVLFFNNNPTDYLTTTGQANYIQLGNTTFLNFNVQVTALGIGTGALFMSLPPTVDIGNVPTIGSVLFTGGVNLGANHVYFASPRNSVTPGLTGIAFAYKNITVTDDQSNVLLNTDFTLTGLIPGFSISGSITIIA